MSHPPHYPHSIHMQTPAQKKDAASIRKERGGRKLKDRREEGAHGEEKKN